MKDEIKEILDRLKNEEFSTTLFQDEKNKLLDYITNLQEENEKVHKDFNELSERYFFTKSRNEKAIEYINVGKTFDFIDVGKVVNKIQNDLLNILQGEDKDGKDFINR